MSHIGTYAHKVKDIPTFKSVCESKGLMVVENPDFVIMFGRQAVTGAVLGISLPDWKYDLAIMPNGEIKYDNWGSQSGSMENLGLLLQDYNEAACVEAEGANAQYYYTEELKNGDRDLIFEYE